MNCKSGKLIFNYGVMNSAKTVNLICKAYELKQKDLSYVCMYPDLDTRTNKGFITSRAGLKEPAVPITSSKILSRFLNSLYRINYDYIFIDEVQFLKEEHVNVLLEASIKYNMNIMCYGLLTDFKTNMFEASKRLVEVADELYHIKSYCECGDTASVNARIGTNGKIITQGDQILIGAEDKYITLCKKCYYDRL